MIIKDIGYLKFYYFFLKRKGNTVLREQEELENLLNFFMEKQNFKKK